MPNVFNYSLSAQTSALKKGNYWIGTGDSDKGPTSTTGYYNGVSPATSGYTVYLYRSDAPGNLSYNSVVDNTQLINLTNNLANTTYTSATQCFVYYAGQDDKMILNLDYPNFITKGLVFDVDAGFLPSYPQSGTSWYDLGPSGRTETLYNGVGYSNNGGGTMVFDGVDDYSVTNPFILSSSTSCLSFNFWVKFISGATSSNQFLIQKDDYGVPHLRIGRVNSGANGNDLRFNFEAGPYLFTNFFLGNDNSWVNVQITVSYGNPNSIVTTYRNGSFYGNFNGGTQNFPNTNSPLYIGGYFSSILTGNIAQVQIYDRLLSSSEVLQNYQAMFPRFLGKNIIANGLVEYLDAGYPLSYPTTGTSWNNIAGTSGGTGTLINGPTYSSSNGGSIVFDGIDDNVSIPNSTLTQFPVNSSWSFTISSEMISLNTTYPSILSKGNSGPGGSGILVFYTSGGYIYFKHNNSSSTAVMALMNAPFQYTVTYSGGAVKIYLNGSYRNNGPTIVSADTTSNLLLAAGDSFSNIKVYDFMKYNRQLSNQEILQNYQAMLPRFLNKNIVTNGLIEYLDAGYLGSYPTSGNTWYNVAGVSGGTGTLTNGPTYDSGNGGSIVFDGVDDYLSLNSVTVNTSGFTIDMWIYMSSPQPVYVNNWVYWYYDNNVEIGIFGSGGTGFQFKDNGIAGNPTLQVSNCTNKWINITLGCANFTPFMYNNGVSVGTTTNFRNMDINLINLFRSQLLTGRNMVGKQAILGIYNRALTQDEITQNYNAQKSRFGL